MDRKYGKKQRRHENRFWHRLWRRLFGHRAGFGRFSGPGRVPKMSQNPKKSLQGVQLLSLQKTKRMNLSVEVLPGAILSLPGRVPGASWASFWQFSLFFLTRLESHSIAQSRAKILDGMLENAEGLCHKSSIHSEDALGNPTCRAILPRVRRSRASVFNPPPLWPASVEPLSTPDHTWEGLPSLTLPPVTA